VIGWSGHWAYLGHNNRVLVKKPDRYIDLNMCEDIIKISLKEMDWEFVEWMNPVQDRKK
jgi:hypothetical protein